MADRLAPGVALPPYAYVPGISPHPVREPAGHSYGHTAEGFGPAPKVATWRLTTMYLHVLDLLNLGYYWEAHEGLEKWWRESPQGDPRRPFFQGLLRLAAAGVKAREGQPHGVRVHARRAAELLLQAARASGSGRLLGLDPAVVAAEASAVAERAAGFVARTPMPAVEPVLGVRLAPEDDDAAGFG